MSTRISRILVAIIVPVLLAIAYFAGQSGAQAQSKAIPALIVNEDVMAEQTAPDGTVTPVVAGRLLVSHLTSPQHAYGFDWGLADRQSADQALASGKAYVVVTIPADFSASVVSLGTSAPVAAQLRVQTDQSHDYLSGQAAQALADAVVAEFGADITEQVAIGLVKGMDATGAALQQAADGAGQLASGANRLGTGFDEYTAGQAQITNGLAQSATGAGTLSSGVSQYTSGVGQYVAGVDQYSTGVDQFAAGAAQYTSGVDQLADGLGRLDREGAAPLRDGATQLGNAATQLEQATAGLGSAQEVYDTQIKPGLDAAHGHAATLLAMCADLPDPARQEECRASAGAVQQATAGASQFVDGVMSETSGLGSITGGIGKLRQAATGMTQFADGVSQLSAGAAQLQAASPQIRGGAEQLTSVSPQLRQGGAQLASGGGALASGASELAAGLTQLSDGQTQLTAGNAQLRAGMTGLADGASKLQAGLQEGADRATGALGDPTTYAGVLAHPVRAEVQAAHTPGIAGLIAVIVLPIIVWIAALVTSLVRRILPAAERASTASNARLLGRAGMRIGVPVAIVAIVASLLAHLFGAPWLAVLGTLLVAALLGLVVVTLHVLFTALWGRRGGAIASIAALLMQLLALRGVVPLEFRAPWLEVLAGVSPLSHASAALQLLYAGGSGGLVVTALAALALIALVATGAAGLVIARSRRVGLGQVVDLRALGLPARRPIPAAG